MFVSNVLSVTVLFSTSGVHSAYEYGINCQAYTFHLRLACLTSAWCVYTRDRVRGMNSVCLCVCVCAYVSLCLYMFIPIKCYVSGQVATQKVV